MSEAALVYSFLLVANSSLSAEPWMDLLGKGGIVAAIIGWFMWRDGKEREKRDAEHSENAKLQRDNIDALNLMTRAMMVQFLSFKRIDSTERELATKIKEQADEEIVAGKK